MGVSEIVRWHNSTLSRNLLYIAHRLCLRSTQLIPPRRTSLVQRFPRPIRTSKRSMSIKFIPRISLHPVLPEDPPPRVKEILIFRQEVKTHTVTTPKTSHLRATSLPDHGTRLVRSRKHRVSQRCDQGITPNIPFRRTKDGQSLMNNEKGELTFRPLSSRKELTRL